MTSVTEKCKKNVYLSVNFPVPTVALLLWLARQPLLQQAKKSDILPRRPFWGRVRLTLSRIGGPIRKFFVNWP
jgi:hypothetical protein